MLCEKCGKRTATTHIRTVVNGIVREGDYCEECAKSVGYHASVGHSLGDMLASMLGDMMELSAPEPKTCPVCGTDFRDIANTGKMGCAKCYETFREELMPYLKRIHGGVKHVGQFPNPAPLAVVSKEETVDSLRLELNRLVAEENYEQAAVIRDKIKEIEGKQHE